MLSLCLGLGLGYGFKVGSRLRGDKQKIDELMAANEKLATVSKELETIKGEVDPQEPQEPQETCHLLDMEEKPVAKKDLEHSTEKSEAPVTAPKPPRAAVAYQPPANSDAVAQPNFTVLDPASFKLPFHKELVVTINDVRARATREMALIEQSGLPRDDPMNMKCEAWAKKAFTAAANMEVMMFSMERALALRKNDEQIDDVKGKEESPLSDRSADDEDWVKVDVPASS